MNRDGWMEVLGEGVGWYCEEGGLYWSHRGVNITWYTGDKLPGK